MSKKAFVNIITMSLMLAVMIIAVIVMSQWVIKYSSEYEADADYTPNEISFKESLYNFLVFESENNLEINITKFKILNSTNSSICNQNNITISNFSGNTYVGISNCNLTSNYLYNFVLTSEDGNLVQDYFVKDPRIPTWCENMVLLAHLNNDSFYGENSTNVFDFSGNGNNGTVVNAVWNSSGKFGGAYTFTSDTSTSRYINHGNDSSLRENDIFTYSAWIYPHYTFSDERYIIGGINSNSYSMTLTSANGAGGTGGLVVLKMTGVTDINTGAGSTLIHNDTWSHLVSTFNNETGAYDIYVNGELTESGTNSIGYGVNPWEPEVLIGNHVVTSTYPFNGTIDEVTIWNKSLTSNEILNLYNFGELIYC